MLKKKFFLKFENWRMKANKKEKKRRRKESWWGNWIKENKKLNLIHFCSCKMYLWNVLIVEISYDIKTLTLKI